MKRKFKIDLVVMRLFLAAVLFCMTMSVGFAQVSANGRLRVDGNKIVNKNNQVVSFAGASLFWSNNNWGGERYYNASVVNYMRSNWKAGIIRAAMGVEVEG